MGERDCKNIIVVLCGEQPRSHHYDDHLTVEFKSGLETEVAM